MRTYRVRYLPEYKFVCLDASESGKTSEYGFSTRIEASGATLWKRALKAVDAELYR